MTRASSEDLGAPAGEGRRASAAGREGGRTRPEASDGEVREYAARVREGMVVTRLSPHVEIVGVNK